MTGAINRTHSSPRKHGMAAVERMPLIELPGDLRAGRIIAPVLCRHPEISRGQFFALTVSIPVHPALAPEQTERVAEFLAHAEELR